jgi:DNA-binding PadR family transcriptional regulator
MSGSEITEQIQDYTDWKPSPGSVYPLLSFLQDEGLIMPYEDKDSSLKRFTLTDAGVKETDELAEHNQHMRNRNKSIRKIYWRLHMEMPEDLYASFAELLDTFEAIYSRSRGNLETTGKLKAVLDHTVQELKR